MQNSFRWYGPNDPVSLSDIRQTNAEYIVTSLHQIPYGEKWKKDEGSSIICPVSECDYKKPAVA